MTYIKLSLVQIYVHLTKDWTTNNSLFEQVLLLLLMITSHTKYLKDL